MILMESIFNLNKKDNKETGTIYFELRINWDSIKIMMEWVHQKMDGSDVNNRTTIFLFIM